MKGRFRLTMLLWLLLASASAFSANWQPGDYVWWEAENPSKTNFPARTSFSPQSDEGAAALSGGDWISNEGPNDTSLFLEYRVAVPRDGSYRFYVRKFWKHGPFRWRFDSADWQRVSRDVELLDGVQLRKLVVANWVLAGTVELSAGEHGLRIELIEDRGGAAAFDAFLLTQQVFVPRGKLKPGQKTGLTDPGMWAFEPDPDLYSPEALLDLRSLNEPVAGQSGFVRLSQDGNDFLLGDGTPVRFWAVTTFVYRQDLDSLRQHARFLAKRGVNMVKFHDYPYPKDPDSEITDVDEEVLDWCWRLVAAMKEEGIYTVVSPYWSVNIKTVPQAWGIADWPTDRPPMALLFFDQRLQEGYKAWMRALYTRQNPYTGIPLAREPAVAAAILQTEDSMLWWTIDDVKGEQRAKLRKLFGDWLAPNYGSLEAALEAWNGKRHQNDDLAAGEVGLWNSWDMTDAAADYSGRDEALQRRLDDQLHFYAETMHAFNATMRRFYRDELGCGSPIIAGNWKTADQARLLDAERWSYTAGQAMAVQRYTGPVHVNPEQSGRASYAVDDGDYFAERSVLKYPHKLPIAVRQVEGYPFLNTESTWVSPTAFQAEGPFLIAAYGALMGIDSYNFFSLDTLQYDREMAKFQVANPSILGMFPAAALIYRTGYVAEAQPVVRERRSLESIWGRHKPLLTEGTGFDPGRDLGDEGIGPSSAAALWPLAYYVGPVRVSYGAADAADEVADLGARIDAAGGTVTSDTGELALDYVRGICVMDAPRAQGVAGFLDRVGVFSLRDVTIRAGNRYGTVTVVPLDEKPIAQSERLLVQVGTVCRPYGWRAEPSEFTGKDGKTSFEGQRIVSRGRPPWNVVRADVELTIRNAAVGEAVRLDPNGMPEGRVELRRQGAEVTFRFPPDALYVVLQAPSPR